MLIRALNYTGQFSYGPTFEVKYGIRDRSISFPPRLGLGTASSTPDNECLRRL